MFTERRMVVLLLALVAVAAEKKAERADLYGEALPPGAIARLGRGDRPRLVAAGTFAFAPDGKTMATVAADGSLRLEKAPDSLELLRPFQGPQSPARSLATSSVGHGVDFKDNYDRVEKDGSWLLMAARCRKRPRVFDPKEKEWLLSVGLSPGREWLAAAGVDGTLRVWAAEHPDTLRDVQRQKFPTHALVYSPDGKQVATSATDGTVRLWHAANGKEIRRLRGAGNAALALAYSADGKVLAAAWKEGAIRLWHPADGKEIARFQFDRDRSPVYAVTVSPDGKWVTAGGRRGIQRWNVASGKEWEDYRPLDLRRMVFVVAYSPHGKVHAFADVDGRMIADVSPNSRVLSGSRSKEFHAVAFSPNGRTAVTAEESGLRLWDTRSGREKRRLLWNQKDGIADAAFSPNGGLLACGDVEGLVRVWEMPSGRPKPPLERLEKQHLNERLKTVIFIDNTMLAAGTDVGVTRFWDVARGRVLHPFGRSDSWLLEGVIVSSGKKMLAWAGANGRRIRLRDARTGREQEHAWAQEGAIEATAFSPDGEVFATADFGIVHLWDVATGRERKRFAAAHNINKALAFSPDGKSLAIIGPKRIQLMELATGRERIHFGEPLEDTADFRGSSRDGITRFSFSRDGKMLASARMDATALIWDVTGRCPDGRWQSCDLTAGEVKTYWQTLAGDDAAAAHRAIWALTAAPRQSLPLLQEHLRPATPKDYKRLPALLDDLDSDQFTTREQAARELEEMGEAAEAALRKVLAAKPSLEVRRRAEQIVDHLTRWPASSPNALRTWRALELLEHLGTPEARKLLERLADGAAEARLTREARAALRRLADEPRSEP